MLAERLHKVADGQNPIWKRMDSLAKTYKHILSVQKYMGIFIKDLLIRATEHDQSKLFSPEKEMLKKYRCKLVKTAYGSREYYKRQTEMMPMLKHHYKRNRHHPEFFGTKTLSKMNLLDILEMLCDWKAATLRHKNRDIMKSIDHNQYRFGYSDELKQILKNTILALKEREWTLLYE